MHKNPSYITKFVLKNQIPGFFDHYLRKESMIVVKFLANITQRKDKCETNIFSSVWLGIPIITRNCRDFP